VHGVRKVTVGIFFFSFPFSFSISIFFFLFLVHGLFVEKNCYEEL